MIGHVNTNNALKPTTAFASIVAALVAVVLSITLTACGGKSSYKQELLEDAAGIKVTAENANADNTATTGGAITVKKGDVIVISPCMDAGSFHLTITSQDGKNVIYDDNAEGRILYTIEAEPGTYDVTTSGNNATGWMTVFAQSSQELADQNASLTETLEQNGVDADLLVEDNAKSE